MRPNWRSLTAIAATLALSAGTAHATDMKSELEEMREMVRALQDKMEAQEEKIDAQNDVLREAGLEEMDGAQSALSSFLETTDFYGWVSATYNHDLTFQSDNDGVINGGVAPFGGTKPNTFSLNQLWFGMDKAPTEESRGGFHVDMSYGAISPFSGGSTDQVEVWAAYASYLAPIGNGVQVDMGELWTLLGAEVVDTMGNFNITRGFVWGLQPVSHVGVIASTEIADGISLAGGFVNDPFSDANFDTDNNKAFTGQVAWSGDNVYAGVSFIYGSQNDGGANFEGDKYGMVDVLLTADPTDELSMWLNYDYNWYNDTPGAYGFAREGSDSSVHALAVAARLALSDTTGIALRGEMLAFQLDDRSDEELYSLTATLDHALAENLTARAEVRWDHGTFDGPVDAVYIDQHGDPDDDEVLGIVELVYTF